MNEKQSAAQTGTGVSGLFAAERREEIVRLLEARQRVGTAELVQRFSVSEVTIRKDLAWLQGQGRAVRTIGGALAAHTRALPDSYQPEQPPQPGPSGRRTASSRVVQEGETMALARREEIVRLLEARQRVGTAELVQRFSVSEVTIRKDLAWLQGQGRAVRVYGGAILPVEGARTRLDLWEDHRQAEKQRIASAAAAHVQDGECIALDSSTTALAMVPYLRSKRVLTVVTNNVSTALELIQAPSISVVMPGGTLRRESASLVGKWDGSVRARKPISKAFVGASSLSVNEGLGDECSEEAEMKGAMISGAQSVIALVDSSKWSRVATTAFCPLARLKLVITDAKAPEEMVAQVRSLGIEVVLV